MRTFRTVVILALTGALGAFFFARSGKNSAAEEMLSKEVRPERGRIESTIQTTGTVLPKNRLEIKPPVNGRVEEILVKEGERAAAGATLAWMSSTERAALLDAARAQGEEALRHWKEVYKAIPLIAPIDGEVIVSKMQPGQTVTTADAVVVLSDELIVRAQVDETDIGKVRTGQTARVSLDAYPDEKVLARVEHIYYESKTVNNVTIYEADLLPEKIPAHFRSGMNATLDFVLEEKEGALLVPSAAVMRSKDGDHVWVKGSDPKKPEKRQVKLGISDDRRTEVLSGIGEEEVLIQRTKKYSLGRASSGSNPFLPSPGKKPATKT